MKIFSGSANKPLAERLAANLHIELSPVEIHVFPDGEKRIRIPVSVRGEDTFVVQSAATPVDQNYMELFFLTDALKRNGAKSVTAVVPYFGYQRQDTVFREGEALSLEVMIRLMESVGVDRLITFDLHSPKIPELFHIPVIHLSAIEIFAEKIKEWYPSMDEVVLISPDSGGKRAIARFAELLLADFAVLSKKRDRMTGAVSSDSIIEGSLRNKTKAILLDDMISSGSTIVVASDLLRKNGIEEVMVCATHPVFSANAPFILQNSSLSRVLVTDTVYIPQEKRFEKLEVVSVAEEIAKRIMKTLSNANYK